MSDLIDGYYPYVQHIANNFIIFTPLVLYGTTCISIHRRQTSDGFLIDICATMLMALILRILYYTCLPYEPALLVQLCVMVFIQCVLLRVALHYRTKGSAADFLQPAPNFGAELAHRRAATDNLYPMQLLLRVRSDSVTRWRSNSAAGRPHLGSLATRPSTSPAAAVAAAATTNTDMVASMHDKLLMHLLHLLDLVDLSLKHTLNLFDGHYRRPLLFWQWPETTAYWRFLAQFTAVFAVLTACLRHSHHYGAFIGTLGLFIESLLPLPQILLLARCQSVKNFKVVLLFSWLCGDCTKITYLLYGTSNVLLIFIAAALFQMSLDIVVAFQYVHYKKMEHLEEPDMA